MATIYLFIDTRKPQADNKAPIKIRVSNGRGCQLMIPTNVRIDPDNFVDGEVIIPDNPARAKSINKYLQSRILFIESALQKLSLTGQLATLTAAQLKAYLTNGGELPPEQPTTVAEYWQRFIDRKETDGTKSVYRQTLVKIAAFCDIDKLQFADITVKWLNDFDRMLSATCKANTRSIHLRNIRSVMNAAITEEVIDQNTYPFRRFKIKTERTAKRSLTLDELRTLRDYPCEPHLAYYRDMFMLIFYLSGINAVDLFHLREIRNGRIEFLRAKTKRPYSIKVEPEAMAIIDRYRGKNYLLDVLDRYQDYRDFLKRMDRGLKQIGEIRYIPNASRGKKSGPDKKEYIGLFPNLSSYWARHTVATIAASLDIPKETIAAILGHGGNTTTDIYIDFDERKKDIAMRRVIDYVNGSQPSDVPTDSPMLSDN